MKQTRAYMALPLGETYAVYGRDERLADAALHVAGVAAALIAAPAIVSRAATLYGDASTVTGAAVYGFGLTAMLVCSASYHLTTHPLAKAILRRFDHAAIYLKIAATYTPFTILLAGDRAASILAPIWTAALIGLALKLIAPHRVERISLALYLAMGWAILAIGGPILHGLSPEGLGLMLTGGALYTVGVVFFVWDRLRFHNAIWHAMVLAASFSVYAALFIEVGRHAPVV